MQSTACSKCHRTSATRRSKCARPRHNCNNNTCDNCDIVVKCARPGRTGEGVPADQVERERPHRLSARVARPRTRSRRTRSHTRTPAVAPCGWSRLGVCVMQQGQRRAGWARGCNKHLSGSSRWQPTHPGGGGGWALTASLPPTWTSWAGGGEPVGEPVGGWCWGPPAGPRAGPALARSSSSSA